MKLSEQPAPKLIYNRWFIAGLGCMSQCIVIGSLIGLNIFVEEWKESFQRSYRAVSMITALSGGLMHMFSPVARILLENIGSRVVTFGAGVTASASLFCAAWIGTYNSAVVFIGAVYGISAATVTLAVILEISSIFDDSSRHIALGMIAVGIGIGFIIWPPFYQMLILHYSWRGAIIIMSGITLNVCVIAATFIERKKTSANHSKVAAFKKTMQLTTVSIAFALSMERSRNYSLVLTVLNHIFALNNLVAAFKKTFNVHIFRESKFWVIFASCFIKGFFAMSFNTFLYSILLTHYNLPPEKAALVMMLNGVASIVGRIIIMTMRKTTRIPRWFIWAFCQTGYGLAIMMLGQFRSFMAAAVLMVIAAIFLGVSVPLLSVFLHDHFNPNEYASVFSYCCLMWGTGGVLGPPFAGWIRDTTGSYEIPCAIFGSSLAGYFLLGTVCLCINQGLFPAVPKPEDNEPVEMIQLQRPIVLDD